MVVHWIDDLVVVCLNLDRHELNLIFFVRISFGHEYERARENKT